MEIFMANYIDVKDFNSYVENLQQVMTQASSVDYALCSEVDFVLKTFKQNKELLQGCTQGVDTLAETLLKKSVEDLHQYEAAGIIGSIRKVASCIKNMMALVFTNSGNYGCQVAQEFLGDRKYILQDPSIKMALLLKIGRDGLEDSGDFLFAPEALSKSDVEFVPFIEEKLKGKVTFAGGIKSFFMAKLHLLKGESYAANFAKQFEGDASTEMRVEYLQSVFPEITEGLFGQKKSLTVEEDLGKTDSEVSSEGSCATEEARGETSFQPAAQESDELGWVDIFAARSGDSPEKTSSLQNRDDDISYLEAMMLCVSYSEK